MNFILVLVLLLPMCGFAAAVPSTYQIERGNFRLTYDERGVTGLANPHDPFTAQILSPGQHLGLIVRYRTGDGDWLELPMSEAPATASRENDKLIYTKTAPNGCLQVTQTFQTDGTALDWNIELQTATNSPVEIGDLAISVPAAGPRGEQPRDIFERGFIKHQFISGNGSFLYFVRASGAPPFLLVTVRPGTRLEYFAEGGGGRGSALV